MTYEADESYDNATIESLYRVSKDMIKAIRKAGGGGGVGGITDSEARFLVDAYYMYQKDRIALNNQIKGLDRDAKKEGNEPEPHEALKFVYDQLMTMEKNVALILKAYMDTHPMAWFFERTKGIGPILSAGLVAHIDIHKANTAGAIWKFAGLDPTTTWGAKQKRPWNATLKVICWKIGDSFRKQRKEDHLAYYGQLYRKRKVYEQKRNEAGELADQAAVKLEKLKSKDTEAYKWYSEGKLPPGHIDARAARYAVKMFLAHLHECWYRQEIGEPPVNYAIGHLSHVHTLPPPQLIE